MGGPERVSQVFYLHLLRERMVGGAARYYVSRG